MNINALQQNKPALSKTMQTSRSGFTFIFEFVLTNRYKSINGLTCFFIYSNFNKPHNGYLERKTHLGVQSLEEKNNMWLLGLKVPREWERNGVQRGLFTYSTDCFLSTFAQALTSVSQHPRLALEGRNNLHG